MDHIDAARLMDAGCLCFRARRTARAITRHYDAALRPTGLHSTQLTLMNAIALGPDGAQPMGRLAEILALEISTLTRNLKGLENAGMVEIGRSPEDRRVRVVRLTESGKERLVSALPHWKRAHAEIVAKLDGSIATALHESLDATNRALAEDSARSTPSEARGKSVPPRNRSALRN